MPYKSEKQRAYFHANKEKLEKEGVNVAEWDKSSKGLDLPHKVMSKKLKKHLSEHGFNE